MIKLSFIVPVYNVEKYLRKCVESLINQDFSDYEIILVDDGSTDGSGAICDEYSNTHYTLNITHQTCPIRVIHQNNAGLSAARNTGIKAARGSFLCFVDSDDYWQPNVLAGLMAQVEREELDVLRFDYQNVNEQYKIYEPNKYPHQVDTCGEVVDGEIYLNTRMGYECYAVMFIVKRSLLVKYEGVNDLRNEGCLFTEGIYFEDTEWTPRMMLRAKRVNSTTTVVYNYFWREGSITKAYSKEHIRKKIESLIKVNLSLLSLMPKIKDMRWINGCIADNVYGILNNVAAYDYEAVKIWVERLKSDNMLPLQGYKIRKMTRLRYGIINTSPRLYCWLRHMRKKYL